MFTYMNIHIFSHRGKFVLNEKIYKYTKINIIKNIHFRTVIFNESNQLFYLNKII